MLYALVRESKIYQILDLDEEQVQANARVFERVVDISQMTPTPEVGWEVSENGTFIQPQGSNPSRIITRLAFMNRFKDAEIGAIYTIANTPGHALQIPFKIYIDKLLAASFVDLARPDTMASIQTLSALGVLTAARANEIITTPVSYSERPAK